MSILQYDPDLVDVIFAGFPLSGFQEDSIIEIEFDDDFFEIVKGVDGDVSRSRKIARTASITVKLMNTSRSNADLTALVLIGGPGTGTGDVAPFLVRDRNGASLFESNETFIMKPPAIAHGGKAGPRDWKLMAVKPTFVEAGV